MTHMIIEPHDVVGPHRTGRLPSLLSVKDINRRLGFAPNVQDGPSKVKHSWGIKIDGVFCAIWDYKGSRWSTYDPQNVLVKVFPEATID